VLILLPGLIGIQWYDDGNNAVTRDPHRHVIVVPQGAWATLGHGRWRMLGRQVIRTGRTGLAGPSGGTELTLLLDVKVLDAQGAKELGTITYELRDREGHVWSAGGNVDNPSAGTEAPPPGSTARVTVTGTVPAGRAGSVVLDLHVEAYDRPDRDVLDVLRFAH
jgi:hypothetical protein